MIVLDTDVVSELTRQEPAPSVVEWIDTTTDDVALTRELANTVAEYRDSGAILPFDEAAAKQYAQVLRLRTRAGAPIATADAQIAATCRAHGAALATRNVKDFVGTGVDLLDPWG